MSKERIEILLWRLGVFSFMGTLAFMVIMIIRDIFIN
jgi:hypothetical protein